MNHDLWKDVLPYMHSRDAILTRMHLRCCCRETAPGGWREISLAGGFFWYVSSDDPMPDSPFNPDDVTYPFRDLSAEDLDDDG